MKTVEKPCYVYWYHLAEHADVYTQGYVGVTTNLSYRDAAHKRYPTGSIILRNAFAKYGEENIIKDILKTTSITEAYQYEKHLRPTKEIGWNIAIGGGLPPDVTGHTDSEETKRKRNDAVRKTKAKRHYPNKFKGTTGRYTQEQRDHLGSFHKGKVISETHKESVREKLSRGKNYNSTVIHLAHKDQPTKVHSFDCIRTASEELGIVYSSLRAQLRRGNDTYNRAGWKILYDYKVRG